MIPNYDKVYNLICETVKRFISPTAQVLSMDSKPINIGLQAVDLFRHKVLVKEHNVEEQVSLITKKATLTERRILSRLYSQSANVPFIVTHDLDSDLRTLICIQDVDYKTDYSNLNFEILLKREQQALAYIHTTNLGLKKEIPWLPFADRNHIQNMINERWRPAWEVAKNNEQFVEVFGSYIPIVEEVSKSIIEEIEIVLNDESSHTLIHNDLNPGNVLIHNNNDVFFIDWEEARYGSFYLDIPIRFSDFKQAENYREVLGSLGKEIPYAQFKKQFTIASRYLGIRYMPWNLGVWNTDSRAKEGLHKYLNMATLFN